MFFLRFRVRFIALDPTKRKNSSPGEHYNALDFLAPGEAFPFFMEKH